MSKDNGGPAFPNAGWHKFASGGEVRVTLPHPGMALRDYFATKAMQSVLVCDAVSALSSARDGETVGQYVARQSYELADAMLKERAK